jgi:hypothetical protein
MGVPVWVAETYQHLCLIYQNTLNRFIIKWEADLTKKMQIRDNWKQAEDKRDLELENLV